jgi:threonine dehydratase
VTGSAVTEPLPVTAAMVDAARRRIAGQLVRTPLVPVEAGGSGAPIELKLETVQPTGSFKVRGVTAKLRGLGEAATHGVVTASTGNHGRALAHVARALGIAATVCVSEQVPAGKVEALHRLGCEVVVGGASQTDALATAQALVHERGMTLVHPFDDPEVIAGQGTIGTEIAEQAPDVGTVVVPLSGGGLLGGIAVALWATRPKVRIVGVSMARAAVMAASLDAGRPVSMDEQPTLADSLQGGIDGPTGSTFRLVSALVDEVVLLTEQEIWDGMRFAFDHHRLVLEGGGAVGIAAILAGKVSVRDRTVVVCSGANAEPAHVAALAAGETAAPTA